MYVAHSDWIQSEIEAAKDLNKPVIGVRPRGQEIIPLTVQVAVDEMIGWNTVSIISAIRRAVPRSLEPPPGPLSADPVPALSRLASLALSPPPTSPQGNTVNRLASLFGTVSGDPVNHLSSLLGTVSPEKKVCF